MKADSRGFREVIKTLEIRNFSSRVSAIAKTHGITDQEYPKIYTFLRREPIKENWLIVLLGLPMLWMFSYSALFSGKFDLSAANVFVLSLTGLVILYYTYETKELRKINAKQLSISIRPIEISKMDNGKVFVSSMMEILNLLKSGPR